MRHTGFINYLRNTSWFAAGQAVRMVIALLISLAIARHLGPSDFGLYNFALSIIALFAIGSTLGVDAIAKREFVKYPDDGPRIMGTCLIISGLSSLILFLSLLLGSLLKAPDTFTFVLFTVLGLSILTTPFRFFDIWFQSQTRGDLSVISSVTILIVFAFIKVGALLLDAQLITFCILYVLELATVAVVQFGFYRHYYLKCYNWSFSRSLAKKLVRESWPLMFSALAITIYMNTDQVMLGLFIGKEAVGEYAAATKISTLGYFIPVILATALFPAIVNAKTVGKKNYDWRLQQYFDLNSGLAYMVALPVSLLSPWLIVLLYGEAYAGGSIILAIHAWSSLFVFTGVARNQHLITSSFIKFSLFATTLSAVINVILNLWLIPIYSGIGAAIATLVAHAISAYFSSLFIKDMHPVFRMQTASLLILFNPKRAFNLLSTTRSN